MNEFDVWTERRKINQYLTYVKGFSENLSCCHSEADVEVLLMQAHRASFGCKSWCSFHLTVGQNLAESAR